MKTKLFKKVYVRTEADLPKETGYYAVWFANAMNKISVLWYIGHNKNEWKDVSSYLQPTEIKFPSEGEIKKWIIHDREQIVNYEVATSGEYMERKIGRNDGIEWAINWIKQNNL